MLKIILGLSLFASDTFASTITYISKDAGTFRNEQIKTALVINLSAPSLVIYGDSISCEVTTNTIDEALNLQKSLMSSTNNQIWLQCYGEAVQKGDILQVTTSQYSLGIKLAD